MQLLGISASNPFSQKTFADSLKLPYPLLSDYPDLKVIRKYDVLKRVGEIIQSHVRQVDLSARLGGEEFIVLLIQGNENTNLTVAERIRKAIEDDIFELDTHQIRYTISIGVAALLPGDDSIQEVISRADEALYQAKENGRNQVNIG